MDSCLAPATATHYKSRLLRVMAVFINGDDNYHGGDNSDDDDNDNLMTIMIIEI